tara:strand:+ start:707 stop:1186 length:480 start_codon:yes stop_codon:yes gene_type:complete
MVKINFDKYDAGCINNIWTWYIPNKDNTKKIKVVVEFPPVPTKDPLKVVNIHFENELLDTATFKKSVIQEGALNYKKLYSELVEKILKYDHNSYGYIENYNEKYEEYEDLQPGADGFLSDEQLSYIQDSFKDSSELYKIIRDVYKNAPKSLTDFNKEEK